MAYKAKKTEHAGPKKGRGAYYGRKRDAKKESSRRRRKAMQELLKEGYQVMAGESGRIMREFESLDRKS